MIVVSNTSPLTNLAAIGHFDLLRLLYEKIHIADGVWGELNAGGRPWPGSKEVEDADWIERHSVQNRGLVTALLQDLDRGEAETVALALELDADLVLMDERQGRHIVERYGLRPLGVVGILIDAKKNGFIDVIEPQLNALRQIAGFYLGEVFYRKILEIAGE